MALLVLLGSAALAETINAFNGISGNARSWAYNTDGKTRLAVGCFVQLLEAGTDVVLAKGNIFGEPGEFYLTAAVPNGIKVYVRVWNADKMKKGTCYNNSVAHIVKAAPTQPDDWYVSQNITTSKVIGKRWRGMR